MVYPMSLLKTARVAGFLLSLQMMQVLPVYAQSTPDFSGAPSTIDLDQPISPLGSRVDAFSKQTGKRGAALTVTVQTKPNLTPAEQQQLQKLGVDPVAASKSGATVTNASPQLIKTLSSLNSVIRIVDPRLRKLGNAVAAKAVAPGKRGVLTKVQVEILLNENLTDSQKEQLASLGVDPTKIVFNRASGNIDATKLEALANLDFVKRIDQPTSEVPFGTAKGQPLSKVNNLMGVSLLQKQGLEGKGIRVAIIDGGFDVKDANLNAKAQIIHTETFNSGAKSDGKADVSTGDPIGVTHGTSCATIIHSIAPKAELALLAVGSKTGDILNAINRAMDLKVDVISISMGSSVPTDSFLRSDGSLSREIQEKVTSKGIALVVAAGNEGDSLVFTPDGSRQSPWKNGKNLVMIDPSGKPYVLFAWPKSVSEISLFVAWDDQYDPDLPRTTDLGLYVFGDKNFRAVSDEDQLGSASPREIITLVRPTSKYYGQPGVVSIPSGTSLNAAKDFDLYGVAIFDNRVNGGMRGKGVRLGIAGSGSTGQFNPKSVSSISSLSASAFALSADTIVVGAVNLNDDNTFKIESYSGRGPQMDGTIRPDVVAPTNFSGTAFDKKGIVFNGTSAATPYVSGLVALLRGQNPNLTIPQIKAVLKKTTADLGAVGSDNIYGAGVIQPLSLFKK
jgi:subtilisin family serine protease